MATIVGYQPVCPNCAGDIDPTDHASNPTTGAVYCGADCWAEVEL